MVQELLLQLKMSYNMKAVILWGINLCWGGEIQILWRGESTGRFFQVGGMSKFLAGGQTPTSLQQGKPCTMISFCFVCAKPIINQGCQNMYMNYLFINLVHKQVTLFFYVNIKNTLFYVYMLHMQAHDLSIPGSTSSVYLGIFCWDLVIVFF